MNVSNIARRLIHGLAGGLAGIVGASVTLGTAVGIAANGKSPVESFGFKSQEEFNTEIEKWLDFTTNGSAIMGGALGIYFGGLPKFSVRRFLAVSGGGFTIGIAFTAASFAYTNTLTKIIEDEKGKK